MVAIAPVLSSRPGGRRSSAPAAPLGLKKGLSNLVAPRGLRPCYEPSPLRAETSKNSATSRLARRVGAVALAQGMCAIRA